MTPTVEASAIFHNINKHDETATVTAIENLDSRCNFSCFLVEVNLFIKGYSSVG